MQGSTKLPPQPPSHGQQQQVRAKLFDSCHRKIRLFGECPYSFSFFGGLVAKARRKDRDGDQTVPDTKPYLDENVLERKLPEADLRTIVDLPPGLDYNEWLASHTLAIVEHVNLVYGTISEFCTTSGCPDMTGPLSRMYLWFDEKGKKTRVAAPQYIDYVMTFTQKTVTDETIFPTKYANEFPSSFESIARKILRLLYHVIAHLYAAHFREIVLLGLHTHLNLTFAHLTALHRRFNLIDPKETEVLHDLEVALRLTEDSTTTNTSSSCSSSGGGAGGGDLNSSATTTGTTIASTSVTASGTLTTTTTAADVGAGGAESDAAAAAAAAECSSGNATGLGQVTPTALATSATAAAGGSGAGLPNQTGAIKCKSSINCGITVASNSVGGEQQHNHHHHHHHQHGEGCGSGCTESMYPGALDMRPPIVNQPESGENNVFT